MGFVIVLVFRPMSFHCANTICEGLGTGLRTCAFFAESWATAGRTSGHAARTKAQMQNARLIFPPYPSPVRAMIVLGEPPCHLRSPLARGLDEVGCVAEALL